MPLRVVFADDNYLVREGVAGILSEAAEVDLVASVADPEALLAAVVEHRPDAVLTDIRMPPSFTTEGIDAAKKIRHDFPETGVVVLSQFVEEDYAFELLSDGVAGLGYLLKERVTDLEDFAGTLRRVAAGGSALDPQVVARLLADPRGEGPLRTLTDREREVLELVAEGRTNKAIADRLDVSQRAVTKHVTSIFSKLDLPPGEDDHRRILAVLTYLRH